MVHLDLFSGIGGFAYAIDQVWDDVEHIFCDNDNFCRQVLKKHWPESEIYDDIRSITDAKRFRWPSRPSERTSKRPGSRLERRTKIDILTGGFPCQPFSAAGLRRGTTDDRHLWPEMLRVIQLAEPTWVIAENVRGLLTLQGGLVFEQVCSDLESAGYEVQPFIIPAVAVDAPHRRDRVWIIAHYNGTGFQEARPEQQATGRRRGSTTADDPEHQRLEGHTESDQGSPGRKEPKRSATSTDWQRSWFEVATELCSLDDGLPAKMGDFATTKAGHRKEQLKAYGNAIVPQIAIEIMKGIDHANKNPSPYKSHASV